MKTTLTFILALIGLVTFASETNDVHPGIGLRNIRIGASLDNVTKLAGKEIKVKTKTSIENNDDTRTVNGPKNFYMTLEFDEVHEFETNKYAIKSILSKEGKIVMIRMAPEAMLASATNTIAVLNTIEFGTAATTIDNILGSERIVRITDSSYLEYIYLRRGIGFSIGDKEVKEIFIFKPQLGEDREELREELLFR